MDFLHKPVLFNETIEALDIQPDGIYVDGTLGGAGHSSEILSRLATGGRLIGIDQDADAISAAGKRLAALKEQIATPADFTLVNKNFRHILEICKELEIPSIQGAVLDLGVSSYQLDNGERGFSYQQDAPLDMRMDRRQPVTAAHIVNTFSAAELTKIIRDYGEEKWAVRIAEFIVKARTEAPVESTAKLVDIIKAAIPASARREGPHPAKRTFQAIRIAVNEELTLLEGAIRDFTTMLAPGGRLCIITFHSLEDRIVKTVFNNEANPCICPPDFPVCNCGRKARARLVYKKPIEASSVELDENPRARSARLRVLQKI